jgi:RNA polymerase sigma-70 factor (family 1)
MISSVVCSDQELYARLKKNDTVAFTEIYNRYWEKMLLIAWNHSRDKCLAEDIVHEVFISLWKEKTEMEIVNFGAFLATKIKFAVFKNYRKEERRMKLAELNYKYSEVYLEEERLDALFLQEYINQIVEDLPKKCKLVFISSRQLGMKNAEIAFQMNISEKGVEANLTRALKIIRGKLEHAGMLLLVSHELFKLYNL